MENLLRPRQFNYIYPACAFRHWLRPSQGALAARDRLNPSWRGLPDGVPTIGIHIRAQAYLLGKQEGRSFARYESRFQTMAKSTREVALPHGVDDTLKEKCSNSAGSARAQHHAVDFYEFWSTALDAERSLFKRLKYVRGIVEEHGAPESRVRRMPYSSYDRPPVVLRDSRRRPLAWAAPAPGTTSGVGPPLARWLLVTDSASLKQSALDLLGKQRLRATTAMPAHVAYSCDDDPWKRHNSMLETVAELLLLSDCDVIIYSQSRFPLMALLLSPWKAVRQALRIAPDPERCWRCVDTFNNRTPADDLNSLLELKKSYAGKTSNEQFIIASREMSIRSPGIRKKLNEHGWKLDPPQKFPRREGRIALRQVCTDMLMNAWFCRSSNPTLPVSLGYQYKSTHANLDADMLLANGTHFYSVYLELGTGAASTGENYFRRSINQ